MTKLSRRSALKLGGMVAAAGAVGKLPEIAEHQPEHLPSVRTAPGGPGVTWMGDIGSTAELPGRVEEGSAYLDRVTGKAYIAADNQWLLLSSQT